MICRNKNHKCAFAAGQNVSFSRIVQLTLADYSLSNRVFDQVKHYKDTLKQLVTACNQTEALGALIPNLEEFIDVAQSEWLCFPGKWI